MQKMVDWETPVDLARSQEYGAQIIHALVTGEPEIVYGNVMNNRLIDNLPAEACVEVACRVDAAGITPQAFGDLPEHLAAINRTQINVQQLAMLAASECEPERVFQAMAMDPLTSAILSLDEIRQLTGQLLQAHTSYLPEAWHTKTLAAKPVFYH